MENKFITMSTAIAILAIGTTGTTDDLKKSFHPRNLGTSVVLFLPCGSFSLSWICVLHVSCRNNACELSQCWLRDSYCDDGQHRHFDQHPLHSDTTHREWSIGGTWWMYYPTGSWWIYLLPMQLNGCTSAGKPRRDGNNWEVVGVCEQDWAFIAG